MIYYHRIVILLKLVGNSSNVKKRIMWWCNGLGYVETVDEMKIVLMPMMIMIVMIQIQVQLTLKS